MADRPRFDGPDGELLDRYLAGECSEAETAAVRRYLMARPEAARALGQFVGQLDGAAGRPAPPDAAASWAIVRRRMFDAERDAEHDTGHDAIGAAPLVSPPASSVRAAAVSEPPHVGDSGRRRALAALAVPRRASWRRRVALVGAMAAGVSAVVGLQRAGAGAAAATPPAPRVYRTAVRQRAELRLDDGTHVYLAPDSRLRVATDFGTERRDVYLEGEAYFDVVHDARRPFTVYVGNASARDLGTSFAARGYADDGAVQVVVRAGEVAMSGVGRLAAGDLGRLAAEGKASVRRGVNVDALLGWVEGRLEFHDAPLGRVLQDVGRWYGTDLRLADARLGALPFTGSLTGLPADEATDVVAATLGLRARRGDGGRVVLERIPGRTPHTSATRRGTASRRASTTTAAAGIEGTVARSEGAAASTTAVTMR